MRILQISNLVPFPPTDGGRIGIYGITKSLAEQGNQIDLICYLKNSDLDFSLNGLRPICNPYLLDVQTENNFWKAFLNLFSEVPYNVSKYCRKELVNSVKELLTKNIYDIVYVDTLHMGWIVDFVRGLTKAPIVIRCHNLEMRIMKRYAHVSQNLILKWFAQLQYKKLISYEPYIYSKFDQCIMVSDRDREELLELNPNVNATTIPAGIDSKLLRINKKDAIPYSIVHIGHTDWLPNYDSLKWFLDEIFPALVKEEPRVKLFVYGSGNTYKFPVPETLKQNVNIIGFVPDLWKELEDKSLAVVPLRIGGGIRLKILEMLAIGQNILTTSIGKEGINVKHGKHLLIADSKEDFIRTILNYFNNIYNNEQMSAEGKKFIQDNYTWEIISGKIETVFKQLISR